MDGWHVIAGLGNPGRDYARTRHNAGFMAVERFAALCKAQWQAERKFKAQVARTEVAGKKVLLCMPGTFMNASGEAIGALCDFYRVPPSNMLVAVDDADLPFGQIRMRPSGSSGGHHGLESIEQHLATREYPRQRIGIGRGPNTVREITGYVLSDFSKADSAMLEKVLERASGQMDCWLREGAQAAMNRFNGIVAGED